MYRRSSYASVAAGTASGAPPSFSAASRAAAPSHSDDSYSDDSTPHHSATNLLPQEMDVEGTGIGVKSYGSRSQSHNHGHSGRAFFDELPPIVPSYLRHCRHIERLHAAHKVRLQRLRDARLAPPPTSNTLGSRKASNTSLAVPRLSSQPGRNAVQDIIERLPPQPLDDEPRPLPSKWSDIDKCGGLEILADGTELRFQGVSKAPDDAAAIRTNHPIPKECGIYYFEVTILSRIREGLVGIGFSGPKANLNRLPGWEADSWGYHGDDGFSFACSASGKPYGPKFSSFDTIGCGINFRTGTAFFTKNGIYLGEAFHHIKSEKLYPSVGIKKPDEHLSVNFGQGKFVFDIDAMTGRERSIVHSDIERTNMSTSAIHPTLDEAATIQELISQHLAHEGYVETAKQFIRDVHQQKTSLHTDQVPAEAPNPLDDVNAINRQKIRAAILDGDIDKAFKYLGAYFPHVLESEDNRDIYFRLRCRKFIEMILRSYEMQPRTTSKSTNGRARSGKDADGARQHMDVDDQAMQEPRSGSANTDYAKNEALGLRDADEAMDLGPDSPPSAAEAKSTAAWHGSLLTEAIQYGMELQAEFSGDTRKEVKEALGNTFALIAYTDARESVLAETMEGKGRIEISEQVNGAILVSLGKPRSALLEKLCAQTEVLVDMLSTSGGAGAFINMQRDYLQ